jgi:superfamily II DNA helicase RecQ
VGDAQGNWQWYAVNTRSSLTTDSISLQDIVTGIYQIVVISPEMLQSRRFVEKVLRKPEFGPRVLSVFVDEAHCVSHWGASFRKKYATIGIVRAFLPRSTPMIAVTATLTAKVHRDILQKLEYDPNNYIFVDKGNDRPNVAQIVRAMEYPMNSFRDIDFVIPESMTSPLDIPKTFVYADDINIGGELADHLNGRVEEKFRHLGLVRPYNAAMSKSYRKTALRLFKEGIIRVLVCTDAAGMVRHVPFVHFVLQLY